MFFIKYSVDGLIMAYAHHALEMRHSYSILFGTLEWKTHFVGQGVGREELQQEGQCTYYVIQRRFCKTVIDVEKQ
jgi:hypothetical protein